MTTATKPATGADEFGLASVSVSKISIRPDLFQSRETDAGQSFNEARVQQIVDEWNPRARFDPLVLVADPDKAGYYIVISGHHRFEAVRRLKKRKVPARVLEGDVRNAEDRRRLVNESIIANYTVGGTNIREDAHNAGQLTKHGATVAQIARSMRRSPSQVEKLLWLNAVPPTVLDRAALQPELIPAAEQLGRGVLQHGLTDEQVDGLFREIVKEYEETGKAAGARTVGGTINRLAASAREAEGVQAGGMLAGFNPDVLLARFQQERAVAEGIERELSQQRRQLTSCEALARELGVDISAVKAAAATREEQLTQEQEERVRATFAAYRESVGDTGTFSRATPAPMAGFGTPAEQWIQDRLVAGETVRLKADGKSLIITPDRWTQWEQSGVPLVKRGTGGNALVVTGNRRGRPVYGAVVGDSIKASRTGKYAAGFSLAPGEEKPAAGEKPVKTTRRNKPAPRKRQQNVSLTVS